MSNSSQQTIVITGGTSGIGLHSAIGLATTGARMFITGRNQERGEAAVQRIAERTGNTNIRFIQGDLSSLSAIDDLAASLLKHTETVDVLVNNAGYFGSEPRTSHDGLEMHFAVNVLAPWRLTKVLLPALSAASEARVINVTGGDKPARIDPDNLQAEKGFKGLMTYTHSKSVLESMSLFLAEELEAQGITVNIVFPGRASTTMTQSLSPKSLPGAMKLMYPFFRLFFREDGGKSAEKAAQSTIWSATSPKLQGVTGAYFDTHSKRQELHPSAHTPAVQSSIRAVIEGAETRYREERGNAAPTPV